MKIYPNLIFASLIPTNNKNLLLSLTNLTTLSDSQTFKIIRQLYLCSDFIPHFHDTT